MDAEVEKRRDKAVENYWLKHYLNHGLCSLCGNRGFLDTTGRAVSPAGVDAGRVNYCICSNGQILRLNHATIPPAA